MRLISFLSDIERSLLTDSPSSDGAGWSVGRMVNFHHGLARLTLKPRTSCSGTILGGTVFLQAFTLEDGSPCLKASLNWKGSDSLGVVAIHSTPGIDWKSEASRIASMWLQGPPSGASATETEMHSTELQPLLAAAS